LQQLCWENISIVKPKLPYLPNLIALYCSTANLSELDLTGLPQLRRLHCGFNNLTKLDVTCCPHLSILDCRVNKISHLDLSRCLSLTYLTCDDNLLTSLDLRQCLSLLCLGCTNNLIEFLDISTLKKLTTLNLYPNPFVYVPYKPYVPHRYDGVNVGAVFTRYSSAQGAHQHLHRQILPILHALKHRGLSRLIRHHMARVLTKFVCTKCGSRSSLPTFKTVKKHPWALCKKCARK